MSPQQNGTRVAGRQLLPVIVDERDPKWLYARVPKSPTHLQDGFIDVTCGGFARAVNRAAGWIEDLCGQSSTFDTLAYIGPSDIRYCIFVVGACKVGYKTLLPSPRNSLAGQLALCKATNCKAIFTPRGYNLSQDLLEQSGVPRHEVQEIVELLAEGQSREYKFKKSFDEAKDEPLVVLHTSGSTGLPKPIVLTHGWIASFDQHKFLDTWKGYEPMYTAFDAKSVFCSIPPFHAFGLAACFFIPLLSAFEYYVVWPLAGRPVSTVTIDEILDYVDVELMVAAPSLLEEVVQSPESLARMRKVQKIVTGGGPLSKDAGDALCRTSRVINVLGTTETGLPPCWLPAKEDWQYLHYNPAFKGIQLREVQDRLYQQFLVRDPSTDPYHGTWSTFPHLQEYTMNDLYAKHPTKEDLWLYVGRSDDVIVLSNGEKLNPTSMELTIVGHLGVTGALVIGQARFAPAIIIELEDELAKKVEVREEREAQINAIWPYIIEANKSAPSHAQLSRDKIIFSKPEKPFVRAPKGTVIRTATTKLYEREIEELYQDIHKEDLENVPHIDLTKDSSEIEAILGNLVGTAVGVESLSPEQDFFASGMDSLQVMKIARQLEAALDGKYRADTISRMIYSNATVATLAAALKDTSGTRPSVSGEAAMLQTLERFTRQLPPKNAKQLPAKTSDGLAVILTGSTGSLGSYLLDTLTASKNVKKIYCLNRRADADQQQAKTNAARGLVSEWGNKVVFLYTDLSRPSLGLNQKDYGRLRNEACLIIHNQWHVNFNLGLPSFEPHIVGALNLINLSSESRHRLPIFFTSSIGTLGNWASEHPGRPVPETALENPSISMAQGYSESKWVTERLLDAARDQSGVSSAVLRVGQIAGPVNVAEGKSGMWNKQEWLPTIIQSSKYIKRLPRTIGGGQDVVTWIPVDILAAIIVELVSNDCSVDQADSTIAWTKYYHLANPHAVPWLTIVAVVQSYFSKDPLEAITFDEWVERLEASGKVEGADAVQNPGLKLLGMFQSLKDSNESVVLDTKVTREKSKVMQTLQPVNREWMRLWLDQWDF